MAYRVLSSALLVAGGTRVPAPSVPECLDRCLSATPVEEVSTPAEA